MCLEALNVMETREQSCDNARKIVDTRVATFVAIIHSPLVAFHLSIIFAHNQITSAWTLKLSDLCHVLTLLNYFLIDYFFITFYQETL